MTKETNLSVKLSWEVHWIIMFQKDVVWAKPFKSLVLSGTHGGKNSDESWNTAVSGLTNKVCLKPKFYQENLKLAAYLEKEFKKDNPEVTIEVMQLCDETFYAKYRIPKVHLSIQRVV